MHRTWHTHGTSEDLRRLVVCIEDPSGKFLDLSLVAYTFTKGVEHEVRVRPHGNSLSGQPYVRTLPSTLKQLKEDVCAERKPAKAVISAIASGKGGLVGARSAGELPRDRKQVYYVRQQLRKAADNLGQQPGPSTQERTDVLYFLMEQSQRCHGGTQFVRDVKAAPEPMCVLATDQQLDDLVRFCTNPKQFAILCIDPTFCIGEFNVTPIVYQNLLLETRRDGSSPVVHGPKLVHQKEEFTSYHYFLSTLTGLRPQLSAVQAFGSDGEESLVQALKSNFRWAQQLRCFLHMRRNIKDKLSKVNMSSHSISLILADIFGKNDGTTFQEGLADAPSEAVFYTQLASMEEKWNECEEKDSKLEPSFFKWFKTYEASVFARTMIKPKREAAGLGSPPAQFTTNASECGHASLKTYLPKQCSWQEFVHKSLQFVQDQHHEIEMAVLNRGQYRFKQQYRHLEIEEKWFRMNQSQHEAHLKKVNTEKLRLPLDFQEDECESLILPRDGSTESPLTVSQVDSPVPSLAVARDDFASQVQLPHSTVYGIWQKAETLINSSGTSIVPAPRMENAWFVESKSKQLPHLVRVSQKGGSISCDMECEHYRSIGICSHTVAVAQKLGFLISFTNAYIKKKGSHPPNLGEFALTGMPPGRNRKGGKPPQKRLSKSSSSLLEHSPLPLSSSEKSVASSSTPIAVTAQLTGSSTSISTYGTPLPYQYQYWTPPMPPMYSHFSHSMYPPFPQPADPIGGSFVLKIVNYMLKVCAGCRLGYPKKADGSLSDAPYDLCIAHDEYITLTNPVNKKPFTKLTKCHYHANPSCVCLKHPLFQPELIVIPREMVPQLSHVHWEYLRLHFGVYPPYS